MLFPRALIRVPKHLQIFYLKVLDLELTFELRRIWRILVSWQLLHILVRAFSASSLMKVFVSAPFFKRTFIRVSRKGSIHLFKEENISLMVIRAIFEREDLNESAIFMT